MKHLRKSILTLLALTLFGGAGAWAQGPTNVTEITTDLIASWQGVNENITLANLQDLGFVAVDASVAQAWTGAPSGDAFLFYDFDGGIGTVKFIWFDNGNVLASNQGSFTKSDLYNEVANGYKYFYTGAPNQAIELTKAGDNQWTLGQTPDYDLELQVEYYQKYALKDIPAGWQILVNGQDSTSRIDGDSLMITETDAVTLIPDGNPRRVKSVTLEDEAPAVVEPITVTINQSDWGNAHNSFTKDGVTVSASMIDRNDGNLMNGGSFSTTLGNFTQIVVTTGMCDVSGTGWSGGGSSKTWVGTPASSVSFSGDFVGQGMVQTTIVCTIQPNN